MIYIVAFVMGSIQAMLNLNFCSRGNSAKIKCSTNKWRTVLRPGRMGMILVQFKYLSLFWHWNEIFTASKYFSTYNPYCEHDEKAESWDCRTEIYRDAELVQELHESYPIRCTVFWHEPVMWPWATYWSAKKCYRYLILEHLASIFLSNPTYCNEFVTFISLCRVLEPFFCFCIYSKKYCKVIAIVVD